MIRLIHLETNICIACTLRCLNCNHFVAAQVDQFKSSMMPPEVLERDLRHFTRVAHVDGYAMIGGEPTLHPQLVDLLGVARRSGVCDTLEVWTNGIRVAQKFGDSHPLWQSFDLLVLSRYPGKLEDAEVDEIAARCKEHGVRLRIMDERVAPNWTRLLDPEPTDDAYTQLKYDKCWFKGYSRVLDWGYFARCCTSPFIPRLLQGRQFGDDMLRVDEHLTEEKLRTFLEQPTFMESCRICAGRDTPSAVSVEWKEERDPEKWIQASKGLT